MQLHGIKLEFCNDSSFNPACRVSSTLDPVSFRARFSERMLYVCTHCTLNQAVQHAMRAKRAHSEMPVFIEGFDSKGELCLCMKVGSSDACVGSA
jgi:hypothetical protein